MVKTDPEVAPGHTETPDSIELKASAVASGCIGAWSVCPIIKDTVFGPYVRDNMKGKGLEDINYRHGLEVFNLETFDCLHVIDATNPSKGNWIKYINCARSFEEQNIASVQQEDQLYFRAIKNIEPGEELLTWFEPRKAKRGQKRKMEKEAKEEMNTPPYSCECGKVFPSMSNMKKHVRFHISCQYCGDIQQNVGGLRMHIKIAHPEVHKSNPKKKMEKDVVLRNSDKKDVVKKPKATKIKDKAKDPTQLMEAVKQKNLEGNEKKRFAAEQIDDGGSRFKFACKMCKRRFSSYINMCRHQSKVHETPEMAAKFYANVANNIAINLTNYIDGGHNSLQNYIDYIRIEDYDVLPTEKSADIPWDRYNFPVDYSPTASPEQALKPETERSFTKNASSASKDNIKNKDMEETTSVKCISDMEILHGKHENITCICGVCRKQFYDFDCLVCHHLKKHPSVAFNFLGFEQGDGIDLPHYSEPSNVGVLAVTSTGLEGTIERDIYHCTGCGDVFENVSRLHVHIVKCVSTSNPGKNSHS